MGCSQSVSQQGSIENQRSGSSQPLTVRMDQQVANKQAEEVADNSLNSMLRSPPLISSKKVNEQVVEQLKEEENQENVGQPLQKVQRFEFQKQLSKNKLQKEQKGLRPIEPQDNTLVKQKNEYVGEEEKDVMEHKDERVRGHEDQNECEQEDEHIDDDHKDEHASNAVQPAILQQLTVSSHDKSDNLPQDIEMMELHNVPLASSHVITNTDDKIVKNWKMNYSSLRSSKSIPMSRRRSLNMGSSIKFIKRILGNQEHGRVKTASQVIKTRKTKQTDMDRLIQKYTNVV